MAILLHIFFFLLSPPFNSVNLSVFDPLEQHVMMESDVQSFAFLGIDNGWITTDERHQILRLTKSGQLLSLFNPSTNDFITGTKLLSASRDGESVVRLFWDDSGDEFIELINLSERVTTYVALEGRFLRALRMDYSGTKIAALLSDGFLYDLRMVDGKIMLSRSGSLPSVLASEWTINSNGSMHWVSPEGKGFSKVNGQIKEQFAVQNSLKIASAYPLQQESNPSWLIQDEGQFLHYVGTNGSTISLGNTNSSINAVLSFDWLLSYNQNGSAFVFHPLLSKRSQESLNLRQILGTSSHGILGLSYEGTLKYLPVSSFYKSLAANLAIHKRIAVEEITNYLADANLSRETLPSEDYREQKQLYRNLAQKYLDNSMDAWLKGLQGPAFDSETIVAVYTETPLAINTIQWENNRLSQAIEENDELFIQINFNKSLSEKDAKSIFLSSKSDDKVIPITNRKLDERKLSLKIRVPALSDGTASWLVNLRIANEAFPLDFPLVQKAPQKIEQLSAIATIEQDFVNALQWNGQFSRQEPSEFTILIKRKDGSNSSQPIASQSFKSGEEGLFKVSMPLKAEQKLSVNTFYLLQVKKNEKTIIEENFSIENTYPHRVNIGTITATVKSVYQHPLLRDLPKNIYGAENTTVLLVGNSDYKYAPEADYAIRDIRLMHTYFTDVLGVPKNQVTYLENASLSDMVYYLGNTEQEGRLMDIPNRPEKRLIVYFSGHGMPTLDGKDGFLLPVDSRLNRPDITAFKLSSFYEQLRLLEMGETIVFLESCFSGRTGDGQSLLPNASASVGVQIKIPLLANENVSIFTASDASELASWDNSNQTGLFTARLLEGFRHFAQQKKSFSSEELAIWLENPVDGVYARARKWYSREQHPQLFSNNSDQLLFKIK